MLMFRLALFSSLSVLGSQPALAQADGAMPPADVVSTEAQEPAVIWLDLPDYVYPPPRIDAPAPSLAKPVIKMLKAAMKTEDTDAVATLVKFAIQTNPYDKDEIREMHREYLDRHAKLLADKTKAENDRIRAAGVLDLWKGQVEIGAFRSTGNTSNFGFTGGVKLERKGIDWEHMVQLKADYQKDGGTTTREQYFASYQPRYTLDDGLFTYGRVQYERDRLQGYSSRYTLSGGLGYRVIAKKNMTLSLEAGPALRRTEFVDDGRRDTWSTLTSVDYDWIVNPSIKITQDASAYVGTDNSTFTSLTGLEAGMARGLKAKLSYSIEHETSPPAGSLKTDTISRFSLVYGF